MVLVLFD